jgi:hypothetical protein
VTAAELSPHALVINSFSKYFCMTGWRVGWMVVPEPLVRPVERLQQNLAISVPTLSQIAAEAAFEGRDEMEDVKHGYQENRRILIEACRKPASTNSCPPTARSTSMPMSPNSPPTVSSLPNKCWNRRASQRPPASIRSGSRPSVHSPLLCSFGRRNAGSRYPYRAVARIRRMIAGPVRRRRWIYLRKCAGAIDSRGAN